MTDSARNHPTAHRGAPGETDARKRSVSVTQIVAVGEAPPASTRPPLSHSGRVSRLVPPIHVSVPPPPAVPADAQRRAAPQVLFSHDVDPSLDSPLTYRERAYLMPRGASVIDAEEALHGALEEIQNGLTGYPLGRFVLLSMFEHAWEVEPTSQPCVVVEWKDWKGAPVVRYPAAEEAAAPALTPREESYDPPLPREERLSIAFEALSALPSMVHAAGALDFAVGLLDQLLPCDAMAGCLYDINEDCLRVVAARGRNHLERTGRAMPRSGGLLGSAVHIEGQTTVFEMPERELGFVVTVDGCMGIETRSLLVRPISQDGRLLGALQLHNRRGATSFSDGDVSVVNYVASQLADCLMDLRKRSRARR